ncbi:leucine-rich repeat-containing protein 43-like isoform X3 [Hemitrygon akajei]|uniref:leucine-rich repeat-containing protein 43-like isoform X3 n=1 Tax=Hemitrygon akajei TaxID=2704970 RepID=UPI003BF98441
MAGVSVFVAFQQQMKTLCLNDFPCGTGSWNRSRSPTQGARSSKLLRYHGEEEEEQDRDVHEEDQRALKEYLTDKHSPWNGEELSPENQHLREMAISSPSLMNLNFFCSNLKALRLVNKQIIEVDKDLLKFQNLEELTLSANRISTLNSANLPRKLKILELCTNEISSLNDLIISPPPGLQHLGLSYNKLSLDSEYKFLSGEFWPNLISLDLSFNDFGNLLNIVAHLTLLPKLKNLILLGNPIALLPNYRGYIIDTLKNLTALDDVLITPDERHIFNHLSKYEEFTVNLTRATISVGNVTGIPNPIDPLEELPEFPIITRNYFVTYDFLEDSRGFEQSENSSSEMPDETGKVSTSAAPDPVTSPLPTAQDPSQEVLTHKVPLKPWADPIVYNYTKDFSVANLYALKKLLQNGLTINVIEEKETKRGKSAKKKDDRSSKSEKGSDKKPNSKLKDNKKGKEQNDSEVLEEVVPKHLLVNFTLQFQRWFSTAEAWKERNRDESAFVLLKS